MRFSYQRLSSNGKTGPMPAVMAEQNTCPDSCGLKGKGCYAENWPLSLHWNRLSKGEAPKSVSLEQLAQEIKSLPNRTVWRYATAGDLPGNNESIDTEALNTIVAANRKKRGFTYTHKSLTKDNLAAIRAANKAGFTINQSCDRVEQLDEHKDIPKVILLAPDEKRKSLMINGHLVVTCPFAIRKTQCVNCELCAVADRGFVIGFPAHGGKKNQIDIVNI